MSEVIMINLKTVTLLISCTAFAGCHVTQSSEQTSQSQQNTAQAVNSDAIAQKEQQSAELQSATRRFVPYQHHKTLVNYVEQMALDLVDTMQQESDLGIAVTSFVDFDASLNNSNQLGNQIAESMLHQLQKFGYGVIDFKTRDAININNRGDFVFSRDIDELAKKRIASHVLAGTLMYRKNGVEVNARIINLDTKQVIATSQKIIPNYVLTSQQIDVITLMAY